MPLPEKTPDNQFWPLPANYGKMSKKEQSKARVALCQSWFDPDNPRELITDRYAFSVAFAFWKGYYRKLSKHNRAKYVDPDAPMHAEWPQIFADHRFTVITAFRGGGKTMVFAEELPEFILTCRPNTPGLYVTGVMEMAMKRIRAVRMDIETNELIREDFGDLRPPRNSSYQWSKELIELSNGSAYTCTAPDAGQRGITLLSLRPLFEIWDDWERDAEMKNPMTLESREEYVTRVLMPTADPRAHIIWTNTLLSQRALAMQFTRGEHASSKNWHRARYDHTYIDENGVEQSTWPGRFSVADAKAMRDGDKDAEVLILGPAAYDQEFMNKPGASDMAGFSYDRRKHGYFWTTDGDRRIINDLETGKSFPWEELQKRSVGVVGSDLALGKERGDFCANVAGAQDDDQRLWILHAWQMRVTPMPALMMALRMAEMWKSLVIAIQRIHFEEVAISLFDHELNKRREKNLYCPEIDVQVVAGGPRKDYRIMQMQYRFADDLIKLPIPPPDYQLGDAQGWPNGSVELEEQVIYWTPSKKNLKNDDLLDAMWSCHTSLMKISHRTVSENRQKTQIEVMKEMAEEGMTYWPGSENFDRESYFIEKSKRDKGSDSVQDDPLQNVLLGYDIDDVGGLFDNEFINGPFDLIENGDPI